VITDLKMPRMSGLELLKHARLQYPQTIIIMLTAFRTVETAVEAMKAGAYDYLTAERAAHSNSTVLNRGETGTGKKLVARAIHFNSADWHIIVLNSECDAVGGCGAG
jgi:DNA-binding NtrC family response regulator